MYYQPDFIGRWYESMINRRFDARASCLAQWWTR
jgi:hypothetical protein